MAHPLQKLALKYVPGLLPGNAVSERLLIVEDQQGYSDFLTQHLTEQGYRVLAVGDGGLAYEAFCNEDFDMVLLDYRLPGSDGLEILRQLKTVSRDTPVVIMTAYGQVQSAVAAIKAGAFDYVVKEELSPDMLDVTVTKALEQRRLKQENERLREEVAERYSFDNVVGKSPAMREVFKRVMRIAPFSSTVLISGESGTGKEVIAKLIHLHSRVRNMPFVTVNCAAIPETLLESELFGYNRGAFSGAFKTKKGLFEEANGGTLFLDEIGEMPLSLQVKLLRVLQEGKLRRLGDVSETDVDVRIVAATSRNLTAEVRGGRFREDLYYRLNIIPVALPPLRERAEDIPLLVHHFLKRLAHGQEPMDVASDTMQVLMNSPWLGNVRELQNIIERAVVLAESNTVTVESLPAELRLGSEQFHVQIPDEQLSIKRTLSELIPRVERELIARALKLTNNNRTRAAKLLEISHRSLLYKLKDYHCP